MRKLLEMLREGASSLNNSKFFAGIIMILLNIGARHFTISLSKTQEDYLKYNVARELIIFAMAWVGTRDIVTAILVTAAFIVLADYLLNEDSRLCIIPKSIIEQHKLMKTRMEKVDRISPEDERKAIETLEKARKQKEMESQVEFVNALQMN